MSINSLWTEDVTLSLGEQLQEIRTPSGFLAPQGDERVLRVYMTQNHHQSYITLEYAVRAAMVPHMQDSFKNRYFFARKNGNTSPTLIRDLICDKDFVVETAEEATNSRRSQLVHSIKGMSSRLKRKYSKKWEEMKIEKAGGTLTCAVRLEGVGVSLVGDERQEVLYGVIQGVNAEGQLLPDKSIRVNLTVVPRQECDR